MNISPGPSCQQSPADPCPAWGPHTGLSGKRHSKGSPWGQRRGHPRLVSAPGWTQGHLREARGLPGERFRTRQKPECFAEGPGSLLGYPRAKMDLLRSAGPCIEPNSSFPWGFLKAYTGPPPGPGPTPVKGLVSPTQEAGSSGGVFLFPVHASLSVPHVFCGGRHFCRSLGS